MDTFTVLPLADSRSVAVICNACDRAHSRVFLGSLADMDEAAYRQRLHEEEGCPAR